MDKRFEDCLEKYRGPADKHDILVWKSDMVRHILAIEGKMDYKMDWWGKKLKRLLLGSLLINIILLIVLLAKL